MSTLIQSLFTGRAVWQRRAVARAAETRAAGLHTTPARLPLAG